MDLELAVNSGYWALGNTFFKWTRTPAETESFDRVLQSIRKEENSSRAWSHLSELEKSIRRFQKGLVRSCLLATISGLAESLYVRSKEPDYLDHAIALGRECLLDALEQIKAPGKPAPMHERMARNLSSVSLRSAKVYDIDAALELLESGAAKFAGQEKAALFWLQSLEELLRARASLCEETSNERRRYIKIRSRRLRLLNLHVFKSNNRMNALELASMDVFYSDLGDTELSPVEDWKRATNFQPYATKHHHSITRDNTLLFNVRAVMQMNAFEWSRLLHRADAALCLLRMALESKGTIPESNILELQGEYLRARFQVSGEKKDIEASIISFRAALRATDAKSVLDRSPFLYSQLSLSFAARYGEFFHECDIAEAISLQNKALESKTASAEDRATWMSNLAVCFVRRYKGNKHDQEGTDLDEAIKFAQAAVDLSSKGSTLRVLAEIRWNSFNLRGRLTDLDCAVAAVEEQLPKIPHDHDKERANALQRSTRYLSDRYTRKRDEKDLRLSIERAHESLGCQSEAITKRNALDELSQGLFALGIAIDDVDLMLESIDRGEECVAFSEEHRLEEAFCPMHVAQKYRVMYTRLKAPVFLDMAIQFIQVMQEWMPKSRSTFKAASLHEAALIYNTRWETSSQTLELDAQKALQYALDSLRAADATPRSKIKSARLAAPFLVREQRWRDAWDCLRKALWQIPLIAPRSLPQEDQQHAIVTVVSGLAAEACSVALSTRGVSTLEALHALELGRGIITGQAQATSSELQDLQQADPALYAEYMKALRRVRNLEPSDQNTALVQGSDGQRLPRAFDHLDNVLTRIMKIPQFKNFTGLFQEDELMKLAEGGFIIALNASPIRVDAIAVSPKVIKVIPLGLSYQDIISAAKAFQSMLSGKVGNRDLSALFISLLSWMWNRIVSPILEALKLQKWSINGEEAFRFPRFWWLCVGDFNRFPIHAAGIRGTGSLSSFGISTYISTIKSLATSKKESRLNMNWPEKAHGVIATMQRPETELKRVLPDIFLPNANYEAKKIMTAFSGDVDWLHIENPSREDLMRELRSAQFVHLACHGVSNLQDPSQSYLKLLRRDWAAQTRWQDMIETLTVQDISSNGPPMPIPPESKNDSPADSVIDDGRRRKPILAYLSACYTADVASRPLIDEALHLAAAFQRAGYTHVIASLWKAQSVTCLRFAERFYVYLADASQRRRRAQGREQEPPDIEHHDIAIAYNTAMAVLRIWYPDKVSWWANFVHLGP